MSSRAFSARNRASSASTATGSSATGNTLPANGIAEATTTSNNARAFGLKAEDSYAYVKRVALRGEQLDTVLSPIEDAATLSFVITGHLLVAFSKAEEDWWEYLNRIEEATEAALATDLDLLPALMLRSRRLTSPGATGATQR